MTTTAAATTLHYALVGNPNSGKTTLFNALTGLRAKTGNYPGVTVARYTGTTADAEGRDVVIEDLPGTYSLDPISPDEHIVTDVLDPENPAFPSPHGIIVTIDATTAHRSVMMLAHVLQVGLPVLVALTFTDELHRRQGAVDPAALSHALGVPVVAVTPGNRVALDELREHLVDPSQWASPPVLPPTDHLPCAAWATSVLSSAGYREPREDERTHRIDAVLLHPVLGMAIFLAVMFTFFQVIFTLAAPLQDGVERFFGWLGDLASAHLPEGWVQGLVKDALLGGVGGVLVFVPQIALLFLMISLLEGVGYLSRAAFLMDRLMSRAGLEGRAFVALLSSLACAVPGIMATRTIPSARDRIATMLVAPLMTCSARLPVYVLLIGLLVPSEARVGWFSTQGVALFGLYILGAVSAMLAAALVTTLTSRRGPVLPFYMEMPPYRIPTVRSVLVSLWDSVYAFVRKVGTIILGTTLLLWVLLHFPATADDATSAGVPADRPAAVAAYQLDHSYAATIGRAVGPVFEPLGFDWRINIGVVASLSAREVFVATLGQVAAAEDPEDPASALAEMKRLDRPAENLFTPPTIVALLLFFAYALQCMSTVAVMRRETGTWKWPAIAFTSMFVLAWTAAYLGHQITAALL